MAEYLADLICWDIILEVRSISAKSVCRVYRWAWSLTSVFLWILKRRHPVAACTAPRIHPRTHSIQRPALGPIMTSFFYLRWGWGLFTFNTPCNLIPPSLISLSSHTCILPQVSGLSQPVASLCAASLYTVLLGAPVNPALLSLFSNYSLLGASDLPSGFKARAARLS